MINNSTISLTGGGAVTGEVDTDGALVYLDAEENLPKVVDNPRGSYSVKRNSIIVITGIDPINYTCSGGVEQLLRIPGANRGNYTYIYHAFGDFYMEE